jgi:hypothetical protein
MKLFLQRVLSALAAEALALIPSQRAPHIRKVIDNHSDFGSLSAKQRQAMAEDLVSRLSDAKPAKKIAKPATKKKTSTTKGKSKK